MKPPRFSARNAVAIHLGEDGAEMERNRRYQPTRTPCPVYTCGDDYLAASPNRKPPKASRDYEWERVPSHVEAAYGWTIWRNVAP